MAFGHSSLIYFSFLLITGFFMKSFFTVSDGNEIL